MSETAHSAPTSSSSGSSPNKAMARNIMTGVITTVLGATAIYFLGFNHKKDKADYANVKVATVSAWKSYETYENTYSENSISLFKDLPTIGFDEYISQLKHESDKFMKSTEDLTHKKDIDADLIDALQRRLDNEKIFLPKLNNYFNQIKAITASNKTNAEKMKEGSDLDLKWANEYSGMFDRAVNDIQNIAKTLSARYAETFSMEDFVVVKVQAQNKHILDSLNDLKNNPPDTALAKIVYINNIIGDWSITGASIYLKPNGVLFWDPIEDKYDDIAGKWQLADNQLSMIVTNKKNQKITRTWTISNSKPGSFTMSLNTEPYTIYQMSRKTN